MNERLNHRRVRWWRIALAAGFLFHELVTPWRASVAWAGTTGSILLGVRPTTTVPPDAVTDLLASLNPLVLGQASLSWTSPQSTLGGHPFLNEPVASYTLHYATFSVNSLAGDTTSWWNLTASNAVTLQPPGYTPQTPGLSEVTAVSGLSAGSTYYFAVRSTNKSGIVSAIDTESSTPGAQAFVFIPGNGSSSTNPMRPNGLSATNSAGQFTLRWHPVTLGIDKQPITIDHYVVYRYDSIGSSATISTPVYGTSYTDTVGGLTFFYRIVAVAYGGALSAPSDYMDSSSQTNRYVLAPSETDTRVVLPASLSKELNTEFNGASDDYEIVAIHQPQNENTTTLKSYLFQVQNAHTGQVILGFAFSEAVANIQVSYALSGTSTIGLTQQINALPNNSGPQAQAVAQLISLYWFNGSSYIRVGGTVLLQNQALMVSAKNLGIYEIRAISTPSSFGLTRGSPYPRVITPNGNENRRVFWFFDNPSGEDVTGTIYDIRGAKVRDLAVSSQSPTANSLVWDGRDNSGAVVPSGVYLYKIQGGKEKATGTVVVAR